MNDHSDSRHDRSPHLNPLPLGEGEQGCCGFYSGVPDFYLRVSLSEQVLRVVENGKVVAEYPVSTAKNGAGERVGSGCTPRGWHRIRARIGAGAPIGMVFVGRRPTGEIYTPELAAHQPERDWILSRILWLSGLEPGFNRFGAVDTARRYIYIHGSPDQAVAGAPASHGCIRMRNADILRLFQQVNNGTRVWIHEDGSMTQGEEEIGALAHLEISSLRTLPALSTSTQRLLVVIQREDVSVNDLSHLIEDSPALTARLLGLANAAYFGHRGQVYSVRQAIYQVLGLGVVKSIVLAHVLSDEIDVCRCRAFDSREFWSVSVLTAAFSQQIALRAKVHPPIDPSHAYVTGLLVNIGLLALAHVFPEPMMDALRAVESREIKLSVLLRQRHGLDQYEAGAWLIERWGLPELYRQAIAQQSTWQAGNEKPCALAQLARLAHFLAHDCYFSREADCGRYAELADALGLKVAELEQSVENMQARREEVLELAKLLGGA